LIRDQLISEVHQLSRVEKVADGVRLHEEGVVEFLVLYAQLALHAPPSIKYPVLRLDWVGV